MCNMKRILQAVTELRARKEYNLDPPGDKVMGSNESFPPKGTSRPPRGPTCAVCTEYSQRLQSYGPGQEYSLGQISISPWPPGGQVFRDQICHNPQKAHLDLLGVLHAHYEKNPQSGYRVMGRTRISPDKNIPSGYRVMVRTRIFTWANKHITLTPWGSSFSGSNMSQPPKGTSRPPRGPTCALWKESSKRLQSYGPDKNIHLGKCRWPMAMATGDKLKIQLALWC